MPWAFLGEAGSRSLHVVSREETVVIKLLRGVKKDLQGGGNLQLNNKTLEADKHRHARCMFGFYCTISSFQPCVGHFGGQANANQGVEPV